MVAVRLVELLQREAAILLMFNLFLYLRPSEAHRVLCRHIVPPCPAAGASHRWFAVVLHPVECERASKTGEFGLSVCLGLPRQQFLTQLLLMPPQELALLLCGRFASWSMCESPH